MNIQQALEVIASEMSVRFATAVARDGFTGTALEFFNMDLEGDMGEMLAEQFNKVCGD